MSDNELSNAFVPEPERYEFGAPNWVFTPDRRDFLKRLGGAVFVMIGVGRLRAQETAGSFHAPPTPVPHEASAWLHIDDAGKVTVFTGKVEFGQNARTSLTMAVAEELGAPVGKISLVMGDTDRTPWDIGTLGSQTTPNMVPQLRKAAAAARSLLPKTEWSAIDFADIARRGLLVKAVATNATIRSTGEWRVMGKSQLKIDGTDFVTGRHKYTSDMKTPGMLYGRVIRSPKFNGTLTSFDARQAEKMAGVVVRDGDFAGVIAASPVLAQQAAQAVKAEWTAPAQPSSATMATDLRAGVVLPRDEALEAALANSAHQLERTYLISYIAHAPLEPRAAIAEWNGAKLTVSVGTQRPFNVREEIAKAFQMREEDIRVLVPDTGSGYGGKHTGEVAIEAARLAKAAKKPVKLVWTREEEFQWGYFRPGGVVTVRSGIDAQGKLTAWDFHNYNSGRAAIQPQYDIPQKRVDYHLTKSPLRQGSYRGLAATANCFARETQMDELAALAGLDPLEFRLKNLPDERLRAVFQAVADKAGWARRSKAKGVGFGIAAGFEKGGYVATCAEVEAVEGKPVRVVRLTQAFECGAIINPEHLRMQIEGCMVMGLSGALFEAIDYADGKIVNPRFSKYRVARFRDIPELDVITLDRKDIPSAGGSETPIISVAPAIANAIYAATGERHRNLPFPGVVSGRS